MSSLRDKFQATSLKRLKSQSQQEDSNLNTGRTGDYFKLKDGQNKFRLAPKFPGEETYTKMKATHWVTIENDKGEKVRRPVPNSRIHAGTKKDIIDEYVSFVRANLDAKDPDDAEKLKALTAYENGLSMQSTWIAYAWKLVKDQEPELGKLELKKTVRDALNNQAFTEDDDEPIEIDPYTDPETGIPVIIKYNSSAKKAADYYSVTLSKNEYPLTDEMLEELDAKTPLSQLPDFQYTNEHFELALEGLRFFDEEHDVNLFDTDEFGAIVKEVSKYYSKKVGNRKDEDDEDDEDEKPAKKSIKKPVKKVVEEDDEEDEDDVPFEEDDEEDEKPVKKTVKKPISKKPVRKPVEEDDDDEEEVEDEEDDEDEEDEKPAKKVVKNTANSKQEIMEKLKKLQANKKK